MESTELQRRLLSPALLTVVGSTVLLTAAFVGLAALWSRELAPGITARLPFYVLVFAVAFILALWRLDDRHQDGLTVLIAVSGIAFATALLFGFAAEGAVYAAYNPMEVVERQLIVLFAAAAINCTGLGLWGVRHWREFANTYNSGRAAGNDMERLQ